MNRKQLKEILLIHADRLVEGQHPQATDYVELSEKDQEEISPLFDVAEQIESTIRPVKTPRRFESDLKKELLTTAHLRQAQGYTPPDPERELLIITTIIGFLIGLAGVLIARRISRQSA